jgi:hypothetical protein
VSQRHASGGTSKTDVLIEALFVHIAGVLTLICAQEKGNAR